MKATSRRYRHRTSPSQEGGMFKKENQHEPTFFGGSTHTPFFQPSAGMVQRKCDGCKDDDKKVQRVQDKNAREEQIQRVEDKEEDKKVQRAADKKEEEKIQKTTEDKEQDKKVQRAEDKKDEQKIQRATEAKEKDKIQKKDTASSNSSASVTSTASNYIQSIESKGQQMPANEQAFYSNKIGYDFSQVKIHTGKDAEDSAKDVRAKAYTYGNHIVFNGGQYSPQSNEGKKLLVHELAHVVQQGSAGKKFVDRAPATGFDIQGVYPNAASFPTTVFFDYNSSSIPAAESAKIPAIALPPARNITLIGTSSEEGTPGGNAGLITNRIGSVATALTGAGHTGPKTRTPQPSAGSGNIDYRRVRAVDVITTPGVVPPGGAMPSTTPACAVTPANPTPQVEPCGTSFTAAFPSAFSWTVNALVQLSMSNPSALSQASVLFPGIPVITIAGHIANLVGQLGRLPSQHQCHNTCDGGCSRPAYNTGSGSSSMMTLCPDYITSGNTTEQSETLIHESLHATPGLTTVDTAYATTRLISSLTGPQALANTDSFVLLILRINGIAPPSGSAPADTFTGGMSPAEQAVASTALSYLEQWMLNAEFDTSLLYTAIDKNIGNAGGWASSEDFEGEIAHLISSLLNITDPGAAPPFTTPPVTQDKVKVAGMFDRYTQLRQKVYMNALTANKITSGSESWNLSANSVSLGAGFFSLSPEDAVKHLLRLIIRALATVPSGLVNPYVESANEIRKHRSTGP